MAIVAFLVSTESQGATTKRLGKTPTQDDVNNESKNNKDFPSGRTIFRRFSGKSKLNEMCGFEINYKQYSTEELLNIIREYIDYSITKKKKYLEDKIAYTIVLRIRTLKMIKGLIQNKRYSKKEFLKLIKDISGGTNAYERYISVKNNSDEKSKLKIDEAEKLLLETETELKECETDLGKINTEMDEIISKSEKKS